MDEAVVLRPRSDSDSDALTVSDFGIDCRLALLSDESNPTANTIVEHFITELKATTTRKDLWVSFRNYNSTPENNRRVIEPLCRCIANLRRHNPNHPLCKLSIHFAKKGHRNVVDQVLLAAKQYGIRDLSVSYMNLPIQSLVEFCRDNTHLQRLMFRRSSISDDESTMSVVSPPDGPQESSAILTLVMLQLQDVSLKNSAAASKFLNLMGHLTYSVMALGKVTVGRCGKKKEKKIARMRIVSELIKPSVFGLLLCTGYRIENMDVIAASATITHIDLSDSDTPKKFRSDAVQQKLQAIVMRNRELARFVTNPHYYTVDEFVKLLCQFDNCPTGRYMLWNGFARVSRQGFRAALTETSATTGMPSTQGSTTVLTETKTLHTRHTNATTAIGNCPSKLFTYAIPFHLHKFLGLLCLCSFALRLSDIGNNDMAFRSHPELTVATVLLHLLLGITRFVLALPHQRIKGGTRLWYESRIHTLCFVSRSLATILWAGYETHVLVPPEPFFWFTSVIVYGNFVVLDCGSSTVNHESRASRDVHVPAVLEFCASMMQVFAHCLMGFRERVSIQFHVVFIMQMTAFMTTLHRKNLTRRSPVVVLYMLQSVLFIALGRFLVDQTKHPLLYELFKTNWKAAFLVGNTAAMLLMIPITTTTTPQTATSPWQMMWLQRKYVVWMLMSLWCIELRKTVYGTDDDDDDAAAIWWTRAQLEHVSIASFLGLLVVAYFQVM